MISVQKARQIVFDQVRSFPTEDVPLSQAYGRILREDLVNDRDQPPFDKSTMDGILINTNDFQSADLSFKILGTIPAGSRPPQKKYSKNTCYKIMTGALVPKGYDAVIPIEYVKIKSGYAIIEGMTAVSHGLNIRFQGNDSPKGKILVKPGQILLPAHIACAASVGKSKIKVSALPKVAVISTGNELVAVNRKKVLPYQIRSSNAHAIEAAICQGPWARVSLFHIKDDRDILYKQLKKVLAEFEILVLSGGVSKGDFDYVPETLKRLGVNCLFHQVAQKPGKPLWFGKHPKEKIVFGLPGNPGSTLICIYYYVLPFLKQCAGYISNDEYLMLEKVPQSDSGLTRFLQVQIIENEGQERQGRVISTGGSGDFSSLALCDGFVEIPSEPSKSNAKRFSFYRW